MLLSNKYMLLRPFYIYIVAICFVSDDFGDDDIGDIEDFMEEVEQEQKLVYRINPLGDLGVGKSCIARKFVNNEFYSNPKNERNEFIHFIKHYEIEGEEYQLVILDVPSEKKENHKEFEDGYINAYINHIEQSDIILLIYDITKKESFTNIEKIWFKFCKEKIDIKNHNYVIFALVGNKTDLEDKRQVTYEEGKKFADANNMLFFEVSAKTGQGINEMFENSVKTSYERFSNNNVNEEKKENIKSTDDLYKNKSCCGNCVGKCSCCC